ncbi:MAG: hypothetical protein EP330_22280 [Deltaproteobacteria bacterium]|nr:MAG: hypothetical protein EP330_22280 [Deltaproteobacteria bacterium]
MRLMAMTCLLAGCTSSGMSTDWCGDQYESVLDEADWPAVSLDEIGTAWQLEPLDEVDMSPLSADLGTVTWDGPWVETTFDDTGCYEGAEAFTTLYRWAAMDGQIAGTDHDTLRVTVHRDVLGWAAVGVAVTDAVLLDAVSSFYDGAAIDDAELGLSDEGWSLTVWTSGAVEGSHVLRGAITALP